MGGFGIPDEDDELLPLAVVRVVVLGSGFELVLGAGFRLLLYSFLPMQGLLMSSGRTGCVRAADALI